MNEYIISDLHFNHKNIIQYCNRPFSSVKEMNKTLIKNWNSVVSNDDVVWVLGDFAMGSKKEVTRIRNLLNGKIYLILGNHDNHTMKWYYDCGFNKVYDRPVLYADNYVFAHYPRENIIPGYKYFYGHVHNENEFPDYTEFSFCACVERINYTPILINDAIRLMNAGKTL